MDTTNTTNLQLCRICISSNVNCTQMISIFGEDSLWRKITTLADVKIERGDTLPQHVCVTCAKNTLSACLFKKKCEDADNFFRQQLIVRKIECKTDARETGDSEAEEVLRNGQNHRADDDEVSERSYKLHLRQANGDHRSREEEDHHDVPPHEDIDDEDDGDIVGNRVHVDANGEVKEAHNGQKHPAFDFNSIRLMHEYMQQHLSKLNGLRGHNVTAVSDEEAPGDGGGSGTDSEQDDDDDEPLPLIPEIELITPSEDGGAGVNGGIGDGSVSGDVGVPGIGMTQMRGYQCPHCYQIFEMRQVLKAHMQSVHGTAGPVYECTNCKKTYFYKRFLEKHIRRGRCVKKRRNQTRPMQCSDCNVLFPTGHHLGWHKRTGCPSKTAKMPLQQLFKQNIVQYNNFPRRVGIRKPENALYLHNRKLMMANNKRKGRTRIKLDARKIALAKQLILREATTTVIANELNISRTFAWRLRKSLVNGVSLHERVIDPPEEEDDNNDYDNAEADAEAETVDGVQPHESLLNHHPFTEHIKSEIAGTEDEDDGDNDGSIIDHHTQQQQQQHMQQQEQHHRQLLQKHQHLDETQSVRRQSSSGAAAVATSVIQRTSTTTVNVNEQNAQHHQQQLQLQQQQQAIEQKLHNTISVVQQQRLMELNPSKEHVQRSADAKAHDVDDEDDDAGTESNEDSEMTEDYHLQQQQQQETDMIKCGVNSQQQKYLKKNSLKNTTESLGSNGKIPLITQLSPAIAAAIHQLPVNLSIRPIASMQDNETTSNSTTTSSTKKKPRKPNVFIDDEKYSMAKMLVGQNASTMEIAKALNVSQMTAWKLRDAIIKGVPLSYRNRRDIRMTMIRPEEDASGVMSEGSEGSRRETDSERQQQALLVQQQLEHQQKLQQQHLQQQQQIQELLQRQQQLQQQQQQLELQKQQRQQQQLEEQKQQQKQLQLQQHQQQEQKPTNPRRRLKAAEREVRDKEITREILELIKEDSNIQYWKVSARLAEKGYAISPSSVCQKLKSMGIHRRWKPGDKPPLIDMEHLKAATSITTTSSTAAANTSIAVATLAAAAAAASAQNASSSADESYEQQFDMGGAHFLSAFTR